MGFRSLLLSEKQSRNISDRMENKISLNMAYALGQRDAIALLLMSRKSDGKKEPEIAREYKKLWGEHPTIQWHTSYGQDN